MTTLKFSTAAAAALTALLTASAHSQDPYEKPDESWISLSGTVASADDETFMLDYGEGLITVEMDDWDWFGEASLIGAGETVTVYGRIDDSFYELRTIEADSVYVAGRNTYYYASADDEEGDFHYRTTYSYNPALAADGSWITTTGVVKSKDGREFTLDTGLIDIKVDTDDMLYNPLDDIGYQQIDVGSSVSVYGRIDDDLFERREIVAETITSFTTE